MPGTALRLPLCLLLLATAAANGAVPHGDNASGDLCAGGNGILGGFHPMDFSVDPENLDFDVKAALYLAWGEAEKKQVPAKLNAACADGAPPTMAPPQLLGACRQVVAGTNYKLHFTASLACKEGGAAGISVGAVNSVAVVYMPLPIMVLGNGAEPSVSAQTVFFTNTAGAAVE
mmetsp:Transcript_19747/g.54855  ORF Transcript_19747/g.54855 Transcript_19747/m.54855 type:complete len:174 (-) Transcript_19747:407-928(-)|eukprot:CAMPEP_0117677476 /NCGR_PEP_ID=MMETSP0804-20121206/16766_1 /TAXON_ID=1074897 /ORGANISM="Tetraselmis astigmatica, Strain CCMP880" /LENGTH=173 /DNA_ID=CAMNT_0005486763 /DNA_START=134 /DNA_END=655 /DNA_ORIENTATION=+